MSLSAQVIAELIDAGLSGDALKAACRRIEAVQPKGGDEAAERRRAYDRERKRKKNAEIPPDSAEAKNTTDSVNSTGNSADSTGIPQMRDIEDITTNLSSNKQTIPQRASYPPEFEELWTLFPRKVGKDDALRSWKKVRGRIEHDALKTAISKHAALVAGKEKQFIPHPATWLNDGRWQDEDLQPPQPLTLVSNDRPFLKTDSDQWRAWMAYRKRTGQTPINPINGGYWFPSEWPPEQNGRRKEISHEAICDVSA